MCKNFYLILLFFISVIKLNAQDVVFIKLPSIPDSYSETDSSAFNIFVEDVKPENIVVPEIVKPIVTDRPSQTESPFIVPSKMFQIETGYQVEYDKASTKKIKNYTYNTTLIKYGISRYCEFRLIAEYLGTTTSSSTDRTVSNVNGMNSISIGTKIFVCEEKGLIPKISFLTHLELPYFGSSRYRAKHLAPKILFSMEHTLSKRFTFSYNIGAEWNGSSQNATIVYTACLGASLVGNLNMFVEAYGFMTENSSTQDEFNGTFTNDHRLDGGFIYRLRSNLQLDISGGIGISNVSPHSFIGCGASWRFSR